MAWKNLKDFQDFLPQNHGQNQALTRPESGLNCLVCAIFQGVQGGGQRGVQGQVHLPWLPIIPLAFLHSPVLEVQCSASERRGHTLKDFNLKVKARIWPRLS